ncbi:MAG: hypothetical protein JXR83_21230 [Deltaproteobacteria bacterium]|nr:hypothetical protein [Deltaproteobacteria bacterium]
MKRTRTLLLPLTLAAVCNSVSCQDDDLAPLRLRARLAVDASGIDFGELAIGAATTYWLELDNRGQLGLTLSSSLVGAPAGVFAADPGQMFLDVGQRRPLAIAFAPDRPEAFAATLTVAEDGAGEAAVAIALSGRGVVPDCDDRNPCTDDRFDFDQLRCQHLPRAGACDDGRRCTEADRCVEGICVGAPVVCDDRIDCTADSCDEAQGCIAVADDSRCTSDQVCHTGRCDLEQGCLIEPAAEGTPCGPFSCLEMSVCIQGLCRTGPTPEGMPCDDGDPCTVGDSCRGGLCAPGPGGGFAISTPIDFDPHDPISSYYPLDPTSVLAVNAPAGGGLDIVWTSAAGSPAAWSYLLRTRVDADGTLIGTEIPAQARSAKAAFFNDDLYLLLAGCEYCATRSALGGSCLFELRRISSSGGLINAVCLDQIGMAPTELALAVDERGVYVAQVAVSDPTAAPQICHFCNEPNLPPAFAEPCGVP